MRKTTTKQLRFEKLEDRRTMAGNVTATISGGDLLITGDNSSNDILIRSTGVIDQFEIVSASTTWGGSRTLINSKTTPYRFNNLNFSDDIRVVMNGGNDRVQMYGANSGFGDLDAWNDLNINTGTGNDSVYLKYIQTGGDGLDDSDALIDLGTGANYLSAAYLDVDDDFRISTPDISQSTSIRTKLALSNLSIGDELDIDLRWSTGIVNITSVTCDNMFVDLYSGNDALSVRRSKVFTSSSLNGGAGTDQFNYFANVSSLSFSSMETRTQRDVVFV